MTFLSQKKKLLSGRNKAAEDMSRDILGERERKETEREQSTAVLMVHQLIGPTLTLSYSITDKMYETYFFYCWKLR